MTLAPIFMYTEDGKKVPVAPKIMDGSDEYVPDAFIVSISKALDRQVDELTTGKRMGELTVAAYLLMESLHRTGLTQFVENLQETPMLMYQCALACAIGMNAGKQIPEEVKIGTTSCSDSINLREIASTGGEGEDDSPGG